MAKSKPGDRRMVTWYSHVTWRVLRGWVRAGRLLFVIPGKLTVEQIKAGYEALKRIDECIRKNDFGKKLVVACDEFYTRVPHCFG